MNESVKRNGCQEEEKFDEVNKNILNQQTSIRRFVKEIAPFVFLFFNLSLDLSKQKRIEMDEQLIIWKPFFYECEWCTVQWKTTNISNKLFFNGKETTNEQK